MDKILLLKYLKDKDTYRCGWGIEYIDTPFEIMPSDFINFAENDLQGTSDHKFINALSNAKRAIDCQADRILKLLGFYQISQDKFWGFPKKLDLIEKFDIITPRVLRKINKTRNLLEHQYIKPQSDSVEDFLDIAALFLAATEHYVSKTIKLIDYTNEVNEEFKDFGEVEIDFDNLNSRLIIKTQLLNKTKESIELNLDSTDNDFIEILKYHLKKIEFR